MSQARPFVFSRLFDLGHPLRLRQPLATPEPVTPSVAPVAGQANAKPAPQVAVPTPPPTSSLSATAAAISEDVFAPEEDKATPPVSRSSQDFTRRQLGKLIKNPEVLAGVEQAMAISAAANGSSPNRRAPAESPANASATAAPNPHAVFDRIAQSMHFATAYELPAVELESVFDTFESTT